MPKEEVLDQLADALSAPPDDLLIVFCLDASGSMGNVVQATQDGFNALVEEQVAVGKTYLTLTLFDTTVENRYVGADAAKVPALGKPSNLYQPSGGTALYDAVWSTLGKTQEWLDSHPNFDGKVMFVIWTDGEENSSASITIDALNTLISDKQKLGWEFLFMGSGGSAWTEGRKFASSIGANATYDFAAGGQATAHTYAGLTKGTSAWRSGAGGQSLNSLVSKALKDKEEDDGV